MDSYGNNNTEIDQLCTRDCGFFGSKATNGLCSKCYKDYLKEKMAEIISFDQQQSALLAKLKKSVTISDEDNNKINETIPVAAVKNRCACCNKRIGLLGFQCRYGGNFCSIHRLPEAHPCNFDFKEAGKIKIHKENPICKADKIANRI